MPPPLPRALKRQPFWKRPIGLLALGGLLLVGGVIVSALEEPPSPASFSGRGPQPTIACPSGAVAVAPGQSIQSAVNANLADTAFCLGAGVHSVLAPITPKTGNSFTGEFGAVLDGTGAVFTQSFQGLITAHNQDIDNVTLRNLVIRDSAQKGIHVFKDFSNGWVIDHNEITANKFGIHVGNGFTVSSNVIHHNVADASNPNPAQRGGGYAGFKAADVLWVDNEIAYNGPEQKMVGTQRVTFRGNFVHHNYADGIWYDADNTDTLIEGNVIADNGRIGIDYEISGFGVIRNNTIERNPFTGIFLSTSKDAKVYGNVLRSNGIQLFFSSGAVGGGIIGFDLVNNYIHDNSITLSGGTTGFSSSVPSTYYTSRGNRFEANDYDVPDPAGAFWFAGGLRTFPQWQALGFDVSGSAT